MPYIFLNFSDINSETEESWVIIFEKRLRSSKKDRSLRDSREFLEQVPILYPNSWARFRKRFRKKDVTHQEEIDEEITMVGEQTFGRRGSIME